MLRRDFTPPLLSPRAELRVKLAQLRRTGIVGLTLGGLISLVGILKGPSDPVLIAIGLAIAAPGGTFLRLCPVLNDLIDESTRKVEALKVGGP